MNEKEQSFEYFPAAMYSIANLIDPSGQLAKLYVTWHSLINYAIVCAVGVAINNGVQAILYARAGVLGWFVVNNLAIVVAFIWNWFFSVGPMGYLFGLSKPVKSKQDE